VKTFLVVMIDGRAQVFEVALRAAAGSLVSPSLTETLSLGIFVPQKQK
jgi:hypothetical protein